MADDLAPILLEFQDVYCMRCGYNLRGLPGDPRRCPECGRNNPLHELLFPADHIRRQLRNLETAPTSCFVGFLIASVGLLLIGSANAISKRTTAGAFCLLIGAIIWLIASHAFANSCMHKPGWKGALLWFHLYAILIFVLAHAALFGTCFMTVAGMSGMIRIAGGRPAIIAIVLAIWVVAVPLIRTLYRRLRSLLEPLQREVAVRMYLDEAGRTK